MTAADEGKSTPSENISKSSTVSKVAPKSLIVCLKIGRRNTKTAQASLNLEKGSDSKTASSFTSSPLSSLQSSPISISKNPTEDCPDLTLDEDDKPLKGKSRTIKRERYRSSVKKSPYFPKSPGEKVSCIPFPALDSTSFGLVQERLCHDPFKLLIAVIFLNKTRGAVAMPVFYNLISQYPTPADLAGAKQEEVVDMIQHLGLQNQRANTCIKFAQMWLEHPPQKGKRYRRLHYPKKEDGKDIKPSESPIEDDDPRVAWEIGHLPGIGAYALDSWRIFCRDELRGLHCDLPEKLTPEALEQEMQKEWTRVLPLDKELRAYLRWRWLRLGWEWDQMTGERKKLDGELFKQVEGGGVILEGDKHWAVEGKDEVND